jgi:hypothetical protein
MIANLKLSMPNLHGDVAMGCRVLLLSSDCSVVQVEDLLVAHVLDHWPNRQIHGGDAWFPWTSREQSYSQVVP